jgi:hypothetical protein
MSQSVPDPAAPPAVTPPATPPEVDPAGADALGDAGKRALDAMKAERNQAKADAAALKAQFEALQAQVSGREAEHKATVEAQRIQNEARTEADKRANERILKAEVRAAAAGKLADPADALRYIDLSSFEVKDDGDTDAAAIAKAVEDLIASKPYLAAATAPKWPNIDANRNGNPPGKAPQLTAEDVKKLYAEKKYDEVETARKEGRLANLLGSTS